MVPRKGILFLDAFRIGQPSLLLSGYQIAMASSGVGITVRPVRVGWCVRYGDVDQLRRAARLSTMLWGGRFNPIIPVDDLEHAQQLKELFHVDVLIPVVTDDPAVGSFIEANKHLQWPRFEEPFLLDASETISRQPRTMLLDTRFVMTRFREQNATERSGKIEVLPTWRPNDPLADALLVAFGEYPNDQWGGPLQSKYQILRGGAEQILDESAPLPKAMIEQMSPLALTEYGLIPFRGSIEREGIYSGSATDYDDLLEYWNLNAAGHSVLFLDLPHVERQVELLQTYIDTLELAATKRAKDHWRNRLYVWSQDGRGLPPELQTSLPVLRSRVHRVIWNGLNIKVPVMAWPLGSTVAAISKDQHRPTMTFQLNVDKVLGSTQPTDQYWVVTAQPFATSLEAEGFSFSAPNIPEMNEYYGREMLFSPYHARVEPDGLGIITENGRGYFSIFAFPITELFLKLFTTFGMQANPSGPGLIAKRLIHQMGGIQGCRVFKIAGVRRLISAFSATEPFTYHQAINYIKDEFGAYKDLFIAPRAEPSLKPNDAFLFLLEKGVFRAGMEFKCPACELMFWMPLDDVKAQLNCEYCGVIFNATTQLPSRNVWRYRRSGLFGRDNHQEGGIPVCLALQRLDTSVSGVFHHSLYHTGLEIQIPFGNVAACEVDFVFLSHSPDGRVQLSLGEAKGGKEISEDDVANLDAVASAFPSSRFDVFPTFAKTGAFSNEEIERCIEPPGTYPRRKIMLTRLELEPYELFERFSALPNRLSYAHSLEELAEASYELYGKQVPHREGGSE